MTMRTDTNHLPPLDKVIEQYMAEGPSYDALNEWAQRYPKYREELADFTVQWSAFERTEQEEVTDDDPYVSLGVRIVQDLLAEAKDPEESAVTEKEPNAPPQPLAPPSTDNPSGIPALSFEAILDKYGIDPFDLEERSGLGYSVLMNLSSGGFTFSTPDLRNRVARKLAGHICAPSEPDVYIEQMIPQSISGPPRVAVGTWKSKGKPEARTKDFSDGVREAKDMTAEAKAEWLGLLDEKED